jgi:hypothetical protein
MHALIPGFEKELMNLQQLQHPQDPILSGAGRKAALLQA